MCNFIHVISQNKILVKNIKYFAKHFNLTSFVYKSIYLLDEISICEAIIIENPTPNDIKYIRKKYQSILICIFNRYDQKLVIYSYEYGMDDYFIIPFSYAELMYKIKAVTRHKNYTVNTNLEYNSLLLNFTSKKVYIKNIEITLTNKEFMLLYLLLLNKNQYISKQELCKLIWNSNESIRSIDTNICTLKSKIKPYNTNIKNRRNVGYIFTTTCKNNL